MTADDLLKQVHERTGGLGIDIQTFGRSHTVEVRWKRLYDGVESDERWISAPSLVSALLGVLEYEDEADALDEAEESA